jgi:hypothetical protein
MRSKAEAQMIALSTAYLMVTVGLTLLSTAKMFS